MSDSYRPDPPPPHPLPDPEPPRDRPVVYVRQTSIFAVPAIIAINALVFLIWQIPLDVPPGEPDPRVVHLAVSQAHLQLGYYWTLITSAFSHSQLWHIALNMMVLFSFGSLLERLWGTRLFVGFYFTAAVVSSLAHCFVSAAVMEDGARIPALGASGAVAALLATFACLFPKHRILFFGIVPVPAVVGVLLFVGFDVWGLIAQGRGGGLPIGHGAHLGGTATGLLFYFLYLRPRLASRV